MFLLKALRREVAEVARALHDVAAMDDPLLCGCADGLPCADCSVVAGVGAAAARTWG